MMIWAPDYQRQVHGHMNNAYYSDTPDLMKVELQRAIDGMHALALDGHHAYFNPWLHTPDNSMDYQYAHLESVIERCDDVIKWRQTDGIGTQATDIYEQKMQALRNFIKNDGGWSDSIAEQTYYLVHHPLMKIGNDFSEFIIPGGFLWTVCLALFSFPGATKKTARPLSR